MARDTQPVARRLTAARLASGRLAVWMEVHHDDLQASLGSGRILWSPLLSVIAELGLVDDRGRPPSLDTVARTWLRTRRKVATDRARPAPSSLQPGEIAPGVRRLPPQPSTDPRAGIPPDPVRPGSILSPPTSTKPPTGNAQAQIDRAFGHMRDRLVPIPKPFTQAT